MIARRQSSSNSMLVFICTVWPFISTVQQATLLSQGLVSYSDLINNLRNVAIPGTGIPLSIFCVNRRVALSFIRTAYPAVSLVASLHFWFQTGSSLRVKSTTPLACWRQLTGSATGVSIATLSDCMLSCITCQRITMWSTNGLFWKKESSARFPLHPT